jgi:ParB family chromosome partitioning protein
MASKKPALGRGLSALLENAETDITTRIKADAEHKVVGSIAKIAISDFEVNPFQPRTNFDKEALEELAESIKVHGLIQPVTVRKLGYDKYQLISGERRYRASLIAGLTEIPAYIRIANDQEMLELALVENVVRSDLDAIEIAISYQRLIDECSLTQEQLSEKVSKKRATISNYLRLLKLPAEIQLGIREHKLSMGHARAIITIEDKDLQLDIYQRIIQDGLSVRQVEELVKIVSSEGFTPLTKKTSTQPKAMSFSDQEIKKELAKYFNSKVDMKRNIQGKGKIIIPFSSEEDLSRIIDIIYG